MDLQGWVNVKTADGRRALKENIRHNPCYYILNLKCVISLRKCFLYVLGEHASKIA